MPKNYQQSLDLPTHIADMPQTQCSCWTIGMQHLMTIDLEYYLTFDLANHVTSSQQFLLQDLDRNADLRITMNTKLDLAKRTLSERAAHHVLANLLDAHG
jgi:hypothetical protein